MMGNSLSVEVLIPAHNGSGMLRDCLRSIFLYADRSPVPVRVAVLDDASSEPVAEWVAAEFPQVRLVRVTRNIGHARANNYLAYTSQADFVLLLNSDTEWLEDVAAPLASVLEAHPEAAGVGARLVFPDGGRQDSAGGLPTLMFELGRVFRGSRWVSRVPWLRQARRALERTERLIDDGLPYQEVPFIWSTCFMIRRSLIVEHGLYDERFEAYDSDLDWCTRMGKQGHSLLYSPTVSVVHIGGASSTLAAKRRKQAASRVLYYRLHRGPLIAWTYAYGIRGCELAVDRFRRGRRSLRQE